jgi:segregation and condensation protein B
MRLTQIIEALLFASDAPLSAADLARVDERLDEDTVEAVVQELRAEYELGERSFQIYEVAGGFQLLTRPEFVAVLERYDSVPQPSRLSAPALEVLAIIAYRQPLGRIEIEEIRGVGSSGVLRTLTERGLIEPVARGEGLGRPLLYGTTRKFMEHFGFRSLEDLPRPDELPIVLRERPAPAPAGEAPGMAEGESEEAAPVAAVDPAYAAAAAGEVAVAATAAAEGVPEGVESGKDADFRDVPEGAASEEVADIGDVSKESASGEVTDVAPNDVAPEDVAPEDVAPEDVAPEDVALAPDGPEAEAGRS